jgi:tetratricopeptide (TPR) repeat protein
MNFRFLTLLLTVALFATACSKTPSWDQAWRLEKDDQYALAEKAYDNYLVKFPDTPLKDEAVIRMAHCEVELGDYPAAVVQYKKVLSGHSGGGEEIQAYLGLGNLYRDHLNDSAKALNAYERALSLYLNQSDIRDAVRMLVDAKLQTANALFTSKDFQDSARMARAILQSYPDNYLASDAKEKARGLVDRGDRAGRIQAADAAEVFVLRETESSPQTSSDFAPKVSAVSSGVSPDGKSRAWVGKKNGVSYLFLGPVDGEKEKARPIAMSTGAFRPQWSPRGDALVFTRFSSTTQNIERLDPQTGKIKTLFFTTKGLLGKCPVFDPSGTKVAFVYAQGLWVINAGGNHKTKMKTEKPVDASSVLEWSVDGTSLKYQSAGDKGPGRAVILVLDAGTPKT